MTAEEPEQVTPEPTGESEATEASGAPAEPDVTEPEVAEPVPPTVEEQLAERTADLKRLQAEYINYKRRVDRDRVLIKAQGEANVLRSLLTVLDDIGRAADHGELQGGFKAVADSLQQAVKGHRLEAFGAKGDEFDPRLHEALFHAGESADVDTTTVDTVIRTGYRVGDEVIRHAQVSVIDPAADEAPAEATEMASEAPTNDDNQD
ncbi:MAG: nucleotide exchange factor GrpE [Actinomycetota bacterium]|nr:nucleotide exchange factor GrpE [Actinomycetota bacterium]